MLGKILKTAAKQIPWKKIIVEKGLPVAIEEIKKLLGRIGQSKTAGSGNLEDELRQTVHTLQDAVAEASQRLQMLAEAVQVLTARVTIALILGGVALVLTVACWLLVLLNH